MNAKIINRLAAAVIMCTGFNQVLADEVNVYSARKEGLIKPLLDEFSQNTGITVNLVTGKADALLKRLASEGKHTPADLLITVDAGRLYRAKSGGLFQPVSSDALESAIPAHYRDPDRQWFGLSVRARPIMVVAQKVDNKGILRYEDLSDATWRGKVCIRSSNNIYNQSLVASMIAANGVPETERWAEALVENFARPPAGGDRDQIKAAAAGECDIAIANTYYLAQMLNVDKADGQREAAQKIKIVWPNQGDRGAHVNISGAGVTKFAKNKQNAMRLLEFLVSDRAQEFYANINYEYPVKPGVGINDTLERFGDFKADAINLAALGENNTEAVKLMDRAGWR